MPVIENLKNFIRHGKQANTTSQSSQHQQQQQLPPPQQQQQQQHHQQQQQQQHRKQSPQREQPQFGQGDQNQQWNTTPNGYGDARLPSQQTSRREYDEAIARIVAEEKEQKGKLPRYPGLETWRLLGKMGDGAFSNVYKAQHVESGQKVAIKVVRKYELSAGQVRSLSLDIYLW